MSEIVNGLLNNIAEQMNCAEKLHGLVPESFETYQIVNPGDIVLRNTDLQNDHTSLRVGMVRDRGIITLTYLALRANTGVSPDFGFQFLNVWDNSKAIYGDGSGLRQSSTAPSRVASTPSSPSNPPASPGSATFRSIGKCVA